MSDKEQSDLPPQSVAQESHSQERAVGEQASAPAIPQVDSIPEERGIATSEEQRIIYGEVFAGPLPPPHMLQGYEEVLSGAADRIVRMAESQANHRQEQESRILTAATQLSKLGMFLGFCLALAILGVAGWLISIREWYSVLIGTFKIMVTLVSLFVLGRRPRSGAKNPPSPTEGDTTPAD